MTTDLKHVTIYTDGACRGNPGPGGYGAILITGAHRKELSGGFRRTTNNRMELLAVIVALRQLKHRCQVTVYSDSQYVVNGISKGWAKNWRAKGWMRNKTDPAINPDLWGELLDLCAQHEVEFRWVRGHAGHPENERCDQLSVQATQQRDLPLDTGFEQASTRA
ncbi:MAG: ribonuclease HI [Oscillochloridaceae bacterium umkhey_bin13]